MTDRSGLRLREYRPIRDPAVPQLQRGEGTGGGLSESVEGLHLTRYARTHPGAGAGPREVAASIPVQVQLASCLLMGALLKTRLRRRSPRTK